MILQARKGWTESGVQAVPEPLRRSGGAASSPAQAELLAVLGDGAAGERDAVERRHLLAQALVAEVRVEEGELVEASQHQRFAARDEDAL